jgi:hypothetical protein
LRKEQDLSHAAAVSRNQTEKVVLRPGLAQPVLGYGLSVPTLAAALALA